MPDECINEPYFVHRDPAALAAGTADVDDGYLIAFVSNMTTWTSTCKVRAHRLSHQHCIIAVLHPVGSRRASDHTLHRSAALWPLSAVQWTVFLRCTAAMHSSPSCNFQIVRDVQIWDAKQMSQEPLATVHLPQRVPSGFHGLFVTQEQLDSQDPNVIAPEWPLETALWAQEE